MTASNVATVTSAVQAMVDDSAVVRALVGGTKAMRAAGETYLPKEEGESDAAYRARKGRSFLFGATAKTIDDMTGKVFSKDIVIEDDMPAELKAYAENIDLAGRHLNVFARNVFADSMQTGIGFIYVDMPPALQNGGQPVSQEQEAKAGHRPYMVFIPLERVIGWKSERINNVETLTQFRFMESVSVPDGPFAEKAIDQVRVVFPGKWETWRKNGENEWSLYQSGTVTIDVIPVAPVYIDRTDFMRGKPPLAKLAELNVAHWQSSSDQRNIVHVARVPILFWAGRQENDKLTVGVNSVVYSNDPNAKLTYVEHTGAAINSGRDDLKDLEFQMQTMGLQLLTPQPGGKSATGEIHDEQKENSPLAMMANALQDALERAYEYMAMFKGLAKAGSLRVNKDFGIQLGAASLQDLTAMVRAGLISKETFWMECQRRGVLSDSFDVAVEKDRLASEAPELDAGQGKGMNLAG